MGPCMLFGVSEWEKIREVSGICGQLCHNRRTYIEGRHALAIFHLHLFYSQSVQQVAQDYSQNLRNFVEAFLGLILQLVGGSCSLVQSSGKSCYSH